MLARSRPNSTPVHHFFRVRQIHIQFKCDQARTSYTVNKWEVYLSEVYMTVFSLYLFYNFGCLEILQCFRSLPSGGVFVSRETIEIGVSWQGCRWLWSTGDRRQPAGAVCVIDIYSSAFHHSLCLQNNRASLYHFFLLPHILLSLWMCHSRQFSPLALMDVLTLYPAAKCW